MLPEVDNEVDAVGVVGEDTTDVVADDDVEVEAAVVAGVVDDEMVGVVLGVMAGQESVLIAAPVAEKDSSRKQYSSSSGSSSRLYNESIINNRSYLTNYRSNLIDNCFNLTCIHIRQHTRAATLPMDSLSRCRFH